MARCAAFKWFLRKAYVSAEDARALTLLRVEDEHLALWVVAALLLTFRERVSGTHAGAQRVLAAVSNPRGAGAHFVARNERRSTAAVERHSALGARRGARVAKVVRQVPHGALVARVSAKPLGGVEGIRAAIKAAAAGQSLP